METPEAKRSPKVLGKVLMEAMIKKQIPRVKKK